MFSSNLFYVFLFAVLVNTPVATAKEASQDPPFDYLDGRGIVTEETHVYAGLSTKSKRLARLRPNCKIGFNLPTEPDEGYKGWWRITEYECASPDLAVSQTSTRSLVGFVQKTTVTQFDDIDLVIEEKNRDAFKRVAVHSCPSYRCKSLFSVDDIDFSKAAACILVYTDNPKPKGYDKGWRLIVTDYCVTRNGPYKGLRYLNISTIPKRP